MRSLWSCWPKVKYFKYKPQEIDAAGVQVTQASVLSQAANDLQLR